MHFIDRFPRSCAWLSFFGGLSVLLAIDHLLRIHDGQVQDGGLPEFVYYGVPSLLGLLSISFLWRAAQQQRKSIFGLLEVFGHLAVGFIAYAVVLLFYVVGTGIDSL